MTHPPPICLRRLTVTVFISQQVRMRIGPVLRHPRLAGQEDRCLTYRKQQRSEWNDVERSIMPCGNECFYLEVDIKKANKAATDLALSRAYPPDLFECAAHNLVSLVQVRHPVMAPAYLVQTGPLLIGGVLSCFFFGAFFIQLFTYALDFARVDRKRFVALVSLVSIIETVHLAFTAHTIYGMLVTHYGAAETLGTAPWSASALPTLNAAVSLCVQMFFAWRVKLLGKSVMSLGASIAIGLLALVQCGAAIAVTVEFNRMGLRIDAAKSLRIMVIIWLGGTVACDVLMTVSIIVVLMVYRRSAVFQVSKNLVDTFVFHTIENGALMAVCAALNLIFFLVFPNNYLFICVELILGRLYANVLLATLNRRDRRSVTGSSEHDASAKSTSQRAVPLKSFRPSRTNNGNNHTNRISQVPPVPMYPAMVSITREVHVDHDDGASNFSNHDEKRPDYPAAV